MILSRFFNTYYSPTYGDLLIDGSSIIENDFDLSQIGILIEDPGYYPHLSGLDNLMMLYTINHKNMNIMSLILNIKQFYLNFII